MALTYLDRSGKEVPRDRWFALVCKPGAMTLSRGKTKTLEAEAFCVGLVTELEARLGIPARPYGVKLTPLFTDSKGQAARGTAAYRWFASADEALRHAAEALGRERTD